MSADGHELEASAIASELPAGRRGVCGVGEIVGCADEARSSTPRG